MRINIWVLVAIIVLSILPAGVQAQSDDGLVAEWHFDEGAGSVLKDSSGNGNDGVIYGATWVDGKYGKALSFDGVDDYISVPYNSLFDIHGKTHTVLTWVKFAPSLKTQVIIFQDDCGWGIHYNFKGNSNIRVHTNTGNEIPYLDYKWNSDSNWHLIGQIFDGKNLHLILDDTIVKSGITATATNPTIITK